MEWYEALILGIVQGLTEFLPISSSGHLELGKVIFNYQIGEDMTFTVVVHGATAMSIIFVFYKELKTLITGMLLLKWNFSLKYIVKLLISMIPVAVVGFLFRDFVEHFFTGNALFVGSMLLVTASLLTFAHFMKDRGRNISFLDSFIIGIAQAIAVLPGISRSGATISTGLILGNQKDEAARFSFLMVLIPIIGANLLDLISGKTLNESAVGLLPLLTGFFSAFITGFIACRWMLRIVSKGKLIYFGIYCFLVGTIALITRI